MPCSGLEREPDESDAQQAGRSHACGLGAGDRRGAGSRIPSVRARPGHAARAERPRRQRRRWGLHRGRRTGPSRRRVPDRPARRSPTARGSRPGDGDRAAILPGVARARPARKRRGRLRRRAQSDGRFRHRGHVDPTRHGCLRRLPHRAARSGRPALRLPLHRLHPLRPAVHDGHRPAVRPRPHHHG